MSKYPILFESNETEFKTHGIGVLSDAMQCDVTEELNGIFELNMVYPSSGAYLKELKNNRLIYADANKELGFQPFRICRVTKLLNGLVNVYAQHISYDLGGIQLPPFETLGTSDGMQKIKDYSTTQNDYSFSSTMVTYETDESNAFNTETPKSVRAYLMGEKDSFLHAYGGEFTFDRFNVRHSSSRGSDKGFRVKYGMNMVDLNQEESIEKTYTGIYPYYKDEYMFMDLTESYDLMYPHEVDTSKLAGKIMYANGTFAHTKIANVDLSPYFEIAPLATTELKEIAEQYMKDNSIGIPTVSLDVRFENLRKSSEYSSVIFLEDVFIGDTIHVDFVKLGVSSTGRINTIIYDSLKHKNKRISVGDHKNNVADTLVSITNSVKGSETNILGVSRSVAKIDILTNQNAAKINLLVETSEGGQDSVKGSVLVEAINGQSNVQISANKVNLTGYVTIDSLTPDGTTVIDGSRIQTGKILSKNFSKSYILLKTVYLDISPGIYFFHSEDVYGVSNDYPKYFNFEIKKNISSGGSIRFYEDSKVIETFDSSGTLIESVSVTTSDSQESLNDIKPDISVHFSENGTIINLENGEIISKKFAVSERGAFFGGELACESGCIGPFDFGLAGMVSTPANNSSISYGAGGIYYISDMSSFSSNYIRLNLGEFTGADIPGFTDPHVFLLKNSNGDSLNFVPNSAELTGSWKCTPYTDSKKQLSEIVTKQDLISLGLITE